MLELEKISQSSIFEFAATASVAATNASMNTDSSLLGSTKSITSNTWKATTSEESIQNMAIAAATAGAAFGASAYLSSASSTAGAGSSATTSAGSNVGAASNTATAANTTIYVNPSLSNATVLTSNTANSSSFFTNLGNATVRIGAATGSNILATSAIKGQSINEVIAAQGGVDRVILNSALQIVGEAGAMQIGNAAHTGQITQGKQLALHAALGCGIGAGMSGGGSGCASGAAAGVIGELTANAMYQEGRANPDGTPIGFSRNTSIAMGGLSGSLASAFTSIALGDDDSKVAKNIYAGNFVGTNAAANNATYFIDKKILNYPKDKDYDLNFGAQGTLGRVTGSFGTNGSGLTAEINPSYGIAGYISYTPRGENEFSTVSYGIRSGPSLGVIVTDQQHYGYTGSFGPAFQLYPIPYNVSIPIPINNLKK